MRKKQPFFKRLLKIETLTFPQSRKRRSEKDKLHTDRATL